MCLLTTYKGREVSFKFNSLSNQNGNPVLYEPYREKTGFLAYAKTKAQISCAVTAQLISAFVFAIRTVQFLFFLHPKFQVCRLHPHKFDDFTTEMKKIGVSVNVFIDDIQR